MSERRCKVRRPKDIEATPKRFTSIDEGSIYIPGLIMYPKEARKLAQWLNRAAEYLESQESR